MASMSLETLGQLAAAAGLVLSPAELEALAPIVERTLALLEPLESLALTAEPATQYRIL